jgi:hypothetical protein
MPGRRTAESGTRSRRLLAAATMILAVTACQSSSPSPTTPRVETTSPPLVSGIGVAGIVSDAAFRPLASATVQATDGSGAGALTTTDSGGRFTLFGDFDETTEFRASIEGYTTVTRPLPLECAACHPHWWIFFSLDSVAPHPDLSGQYTLTFLADERCVGLPEQLRTRTFDATITRSPRPDTPANPRFDVTLRSASTVAGFDRFVIGVSGDYLAANIGDVGHNGAGVIERIGANTYVTLAGAISATVENTSTISAAMDGAVGRCELPGDLKSEYDCPISPLAANACVSPNHRLLMRRH